MENETGERTIDDVYAKCSLSDMVKAVERARNMGADEQVEMLDAYIHSRWGAPAITGVMHIGGSDG